MPKNGVVHFTFTIIATVITVESARKRHLFWMIFVVSQKHTDTPKQTQTQAHQTQIE